MKPVNLESDGENKDEEDNISTASETEDVQEASEETKKFDTPVASISKFIARDGSVWSSQPPSTGRVRSCNIIKSRMHKVSLPPGKNIEDSIDGLSIKSRMHKVSLPPGKNIEDSIDGLSLFIDEAILNEIVSHTNKEAERVLIDIPWKSRENIEICAFLGLLLTACHLGASNTSYDILWSSLYGAPIFRATIELKRFKSLLRFIRFDDKETRTERRRYNKLAAIRASWEKINNNLKRHWEKINNNLKRHYLPGENVIVDKQLYPSEEDVHLDNNMPLTPDKYEIKIWWVCDSQTYYPLNGIPYTGKE
ncbi:Transposase IS4 [Popillia japonica]|uniref:Transposase IS4 n=1 Tax=Popillia japonica TaxID=7064 RepID=A0AAW1N2P2_POPJA